jgi:hypothetical protein
MSTRRICSFLVGIAMLSALPIVHTSAADAQHTNVKPVPQTTQLRRASAAFESIVPVLRHPRCMNCHSVGDYPRQGDDNHQHSMQVQRGPDGHGVNAVQCGACHQDHNLPGLHTPPGAPDWHLPPQNMPMIWEGLTDHELCVLLKDTRSNGNRTVAQIVEHMRSPLVLWGWNPGEGRQPIPISHSQFMTKIEVWASQGASCPK